MFPRPPMCMFNALEGIWEGLQALTQWVVQSAPWEQPGTASLSSAMGVLRSSGSWQGCSCLCQHCQAALGPGWCKRDSVMLVHKGPSAEWFVSFILVILLRYSALNRLKCMKKCWMGSFLRAEIKLEEFLILEGFFFNWSWPVKDDE